MNPCLKGDHISYDSLRIPGTHLAVAHNFRNQHLEPHLRYDQAARLGLMNVEQYGEFRRRGGGGGGEGVVVVIGVPSGVFFRGGVAGGVFFRGVVGGV